eukprot:CAMPEP_0201675130 /NCGR_PEP_ID=MMETSP0494-20130426/38851_1 /ASSEMBLY_ACC=CAM_ASM_000839 /TAXON_ID=420259 /ORGANISM="Thalassiosira gravida, Strain GMp14c1" /LENGTH=42 /DNA_ID= /DNA_START= /DNA_END= /DNA_ORIENTATION=
MAFTGPMCILCILSGYAVCSSSAMPVNAPNGRGKNPKLDVST